MHREIKVADVEMDSFYHIKSIKNIYTAEHMPVGTMCKQDADQQALTKWLDRRTIPKGRPRLQEVLDIRNMITSKELLKDSYGLSLSDQYWFKPKILRVMGANPVF